MARPQAPYRPLSPNPHGTPERVRCACCRGQAMRATYPGDVPAGWKLYGEDRYVCPMCLEARR